MGTLWELSFALSLFLFSGTKAQAFFSELAKMICGIDLIIAILLATQDQISQHPPTKAVSKKEIQSKMHRFQH